MSDMKEALYQMEQRIKMHELDGTTSNENEREKILLNYINNLQDRINKAIEYIEKNTIDTTFYIDFDGEINYVLKLLKGEISNNEKEKM